MIQADEDVGKVAQATPIVVCALKLCLHILRFLRFDRHCSSIHAAKALELFLASLVQASVKDAEARGSKKLTAYGL